MDTILDHCAKKTTEHSAMELLGPRVSRMLPGFLDYLRVEGSCTQETLDRYKSAIERFCQLVGDCQVGAVSSETVSLYKRKLMDAGLAAATISVMLACLRSFLRYLRDVRQLKVLDAEKVRRPKIPKREVEYLTKEEVRRFLGAIPTGTFAGVRDRALAEALCSSGMRISEALLLDRDTIDWELREATVIGKGNKQRKVYFSEETLVWLMRYLEHRHDAERALFVTQGNRPQRLQARGTWKRFNRYGEFAGLGKRVHPHMLRHTMATTLLANGCSIGHIRTLLGHAHLATTCRYYLGSMSNAEAKAAHDKYLSYEDNEGERMNGKSPGRENVSAETLTEEAA